MITVTQTTPRPIVPLADMKPGQFGRLLQSGYGGEYVMCVGSGDRRAVVLLNRPESCWHVPIPTTISVELYRDMAINIS